MIMEVGLSICIILNQCAMFDVAIQPSDTCNSFPVFFLEHLCQHLLKGIENRVVLIYLHKRLYQVSPNGFSGCSVFVQS